MVSNKQEHIGFKHRRLRKIKVTRLRLGSYNIGSLTGRYLELVDIMKMRKINILCLQETKWVINRAKTIVGKRQEYKLWCSGHDRNQNEACVIHLNM